MGCIMRECSNPECGFADGKLPPIGSRHTCPKCGKYMSVSFDEWECREEYKCEDDFEEEEEEDIPSDELWISK